MSRDMKKDWWFKFEYSKWDDADLRRCCLETQGFWLRVYITLRKTGKFSITATVEDFTRMVGCSAGEVRRSITELQKHNVADVTLCNGSVQKSNSDVTLLSRSLKSELNTREKNKLRVRKFRGNGDVTPTVRDRVKSKSKELEEREELITNNVECEKPKPIARTVKKSNDEFLSDLKKDPTYSHIDIERELGKAKRWAEANNKQVNQRSFINWLNRIDKPMNGNGHSARPADPGKWTGDELPVDDASCKTCGEDYCMKDHINEARAA